MNKMFSFDIKSANQICSTSKHAKRARVIRMVLVVFLSLSFLLLQNACTSILTSTGSLKPYYQWLNENDQNRDYREYVALGSISNPENYWVKYINSLLYMWEGFSVPYNKGGGGTPQPTQTAQTCKPDMEFCSQDSECCSGRCDFYGGNVKRCQTP